MKRVLIVDDDPAFVGLLTKAFEMSSEYQISSFNDPRTALEKIENDMPDAILLDVRMPGITGIDFLRHLRAMEKGRDVTVIMTTNDSSLETMGQTAEFNVRGYVLKANESLKTIVSMVDRIVGHA